VGDQMQALNEDVDRYIERLQVQFARMETAMSQSLSLLDWLTLQIDYLPRIGGSSRSQSIWRR